MFFPALALMSALVAGQQTPSPGAPQARRPEPQPVQTAAVAPAAPASAVPPGDTPRQVCRSVPVTGSRFPIRQCRNGVETAADRAESREMLRRMQGARTPPVN